MTTTSQERRTVTVALADGHTAPGCLELAWRQQRKLATGRYSWPCSVLDVSDGFDAWWRTLGSARKRWNRATRLGYRFAEIHREQHEDDIYAINTSLEQRQGRPMIDAYRVKQHYSPLPDYQCLRHCIRSFGVLHADTLVAYILAYQLGGLTLISQILGHGDHLWQGVMFLLMIETVREQIRSAGTERVFYNMHDSGTAGLREFKEAFRFAPTRIQWEL